MKKVGLLIISLFFATISKAQTDTSKAPTVYIIRSTGFSGSGVNYRVHLDEAYSCDIPNKQYIILHPRPGTYTFYATVWSSRKKKEKLGLTVSIENDNTYYFRFVQSQHAMQFRLYIEEITINSASPLLASCKLHSDCSK